MFAVCRTRPLGEGRAVGGTLVNERNEQLTTDANNRQRCHYCGRRP